MKRYITCAVSQESAQHIKLQFQSEIADSSLADVVWQISVYPLSRAYRVTITLTAKTYHRKKFTYTVYPKKLEQAIKQAVYEINAWVKERHYILKADATVKLLYANQVPVGYIVGEGRGRGQTWLYTRLTPDNASRTGSNRTGSKSIDVSGYSEIFTTYSDIHGIVPVSDVEYESWTAWRDKQVAEGRSYDPSTTNFYLYLPADDWSIEYIPMSEATPISNNTDALRRLSL